MTYLAHHRPMRMRRAMYRRPTWGVRETPKRISGSKLAIDMFETEDQVIVTAMVPGVAAQGIEVNITGDVLTIEARPEDLGESQERNYVRQERFRGSLHRTVHLPSPVVADKTEAVIENGLLTLTMPKTDQAKVKSIKVVKH